MQKTKYLLFLIVVIAITLLVYGNRNILINIVDGSTQSVIKQENKTAIKSEIIPIKPIKHETISIKTIEQNIEAFDQDPIVNLAIYGAQYGSCLIIKARDKYHNTAKNPYTIQWAEKQQAYFNKTKEKCQIFQQEHPEFETFAQLGIAPEITFKAESVLAEYLNFNKFNFSTEESLDYLFAIGQGYPDLIPGSIMRIHEYNKLVIIPDLKAILQSENTNYTYKIEQFTSNLLACQLGANCGITSQIMGTYCSYEQNFCTDNFLTLYHTRLSLGVKADIQLALPYFKQLYKID